MATPDGRYLRPLTLAELLDRTFSLYRRHFLLFVGIMALPSIVALTWGVGMQVFRLSGLRAVTPGHQVWPGQVLAMVVPFLIAAFGLATASCALVSLPMPARNRTALRALPGG